MVTWLDISFITKVEVSVCSITYIVLNNVLAGDVEDTKLVDLDANLLALGAKSWSAGERGVELSLVIKLADV